MIYNRTEALNVLASIAQDLNILRNRKYDLSTADFDDRFHKILFGVFQNIALQKDVKALDAIMVDGYLREFPIQYTEFKNNNGIEYINLLIEKSCSFDFAYTMVKKMTLLRRFQSVGMDIREIYDENSIDPTHCEAQAEKLLKLTIDDIKRHFKLKFLEIDQDFKDNSDSFGFEAGEDIDDLIKRCIEGNEWGVSFNSKIFNAIFRGMNGSKLMIRSAGTGCGKTRLSIADLANLSCYERYDTEKKEWILNNSQIETLFISTELTKDELHLALLAYVSGIPEEQIRNGKYDELSKIRIDRAIESIKRSKIKFEYTSNFSITEIENIIESHIIRHDIKYIFFDYIQITQALSSELMKLFGYTLREDQMLQQLSSALKNISNKYDVFILTATQVNRNHKFDECIDVTHLRGGQATADKADYVVICCKVTEKEYGKIKTIAESNFFEKPTHCFHICKNRGGKWNDIILWSRINLDTITTKDLFVTTKDYELITSIAPVVLDRV